MWLTSKRPALVRTAMCSGMMPAYSTGISQPQNSIILPPSFLWSSLKRVFFMVLPFSERNPKLSQLGTSRKSCPGARFCYNRSPKMIAFKSRLKDAIAERLRVAYPDLGEFEMAPTPDPKMGDLALTFPFTLAKTLRKPPRAIALEAAPLLASVEGVVKAEVAGGGFLNLWLDRAAVLAEAVRLAGRTDLVPDEGKIVIEHTNINPNKAAHIGHLRNACLGDTLARCLRYMGERVEVQNYIDDTGVQVVDVVFGLMELERLTVEGLERLPGKFDYYCWDLYARVSAYLAAHPEAQARKSDIMKAIEHGRDPEYGLSRYVSRRIVRAHLATMARLGISYDVLPCESTILHLKFWEKAFELLRERQAIYLAAEGENKGCWVMRLEEDEEREKVIVRSDGTVTYVGKDIAYQLWKFGLLGRDFHYEPFAEDKGRTLWISTAEPSAASPGFGRATKVYNVIDTRQSYLQKVVVQGLRSLKFEAQAAKSVHFSYEMVALSPKSLGELGYAASAEEKERAYLEVSGRKGLGVKADDLLDRLEAKALAEIEKRNPDQPAGREAQDRPGHRHRGPALLHAPLRPELGHRLRLRGGPQLRGRDRPLPPVHGGPDGQHLPQAQGAARPGRGRHRPAGGRRVSLPGRPGRGRTGRRLGRPPDGRLAR